MRRLLAVFVLISFFGSPSLVLAQEIATESATPVPTEIQDPSPTPEITPIPTIETLPEILQEQTSDSNESAKIREKTIFKKLKKTHYQVDESVTTSVENTYDTEVEVAILGPNDQPVAFPILKQHVGDATKVTLLPTYKMRPGRYRLKLVDANGQIQDQEFTWGVLALNPNKSIYNLGETSKISIAVLDELGAMVCNANVILEITNPDGSKTELSTDTKEIKINPECNIRDYTLNPDYATSYLLSQIGTYNITLTAKTANGVYSITDSIQAQNNIVYDISRDGPTRIFPLKAYPVKINIKFAKDYIGKIVETVPSEFEITQVQETHPYSEILTELLHPQINVPTVLGLPFTGDYPISQGFGETITDPALLSLYQNFGLAGHDGVDYSMPQNIPVLAVDGGKVIQSGSGAYGTTVVIEHSWGKTYYGHLNSTQVTVDQTVEKGHQIALSGNTGITTGPHLHFGIKPTGSSFFNGYYGKVDPIPYLTNSLLSTQSVKKIVWDVNAKAGSEITLGYRFDAPEITPELYLTGPLKLYAQSQEVPDTKVDPDSPNPFVLGLSTQRDDPVLIFQENRQWQIAADADVTIDSVVNANGPGLFKDHPSMVFTTDQIGYIFYNDSDGAGGGDCVYSKTTDGGASWGAAVTVFNSATLTSSCIPWYDRWTPTDVTGNYIHVLIGDSSTDDLFYDRVDTANSDTQLGEVAIQATSTNVGAADSLSITKGSDGILYAASTDGNTGRDILSCSTTCGTGSNWTSMTDNLDAQDWIVMLPLANAKIVLIRDDVSQDDLDYDLLTGTTWAGFVDIDTDVIEGTNMPMLFGATVRLDTGHIYVSYVANQGTDDTSEVRTQVFDGSSWTAKTDVVPDTEPTATEMLMHTNIATDIETGDIYVAYTLGDTSTTQNIYYKKSTDNMDTWGSQTQLNTSNSGGSNSQVNLNVTSGERIYFRYHNDGINDGLFGGTVVDLTPPHVSQVMRHGMWFSKIGLEQYFSF